MKYKVRNISGAHLFFKGKSIPARGSVVIETNDELKSDDNLEIIADKVLSSKNKKEKKI